MKVYIVNGYSGEYEDYMEWVAGGVVFLTREMAESFKEECEKQATYMEESTNDPEDNREYPRYYLEQIPEWGVDKCACYDYTATGYGISEYDVCEEF